MNYESSYNNYMKNNPYQAKCNPNKLYGNTQYSNILPYGNKETKNYGKQYINPNNYKTDIYNNDKFIPVKIPDHNDITLIIIKNQLNGELEYEEKNINTTNPFIYDNKPSSSRKKAFTKEEALEISRMLGIDYNKVKFDVEQFRMGLDVELEHGTISPNTNVTNDDFLLTGKIALAHLNEFPDYYTRLYKLEEDAKAYWTLQEYIL